MNPSDPEGVLVYAYGSNMLTRRIRERVPTAIWIGVGELRGYTMAFEKLGRDGSAKANVSPARDPDDRVFGVIFRISRSELPQLDEHEGGYRRESVHVITAGGYSVEVQTYRALEDRIRPGLLPFGWYRDLVAAGAREHGLPGHHVLWIECHPTRDDPEPDRRDRARRLLDPPT